MARRKTRKTTTRKTKSKRGRPKGYKVKGAARVYKYKLVKGKLTYVGTIKKDRLDD